MTSSWLYSLSTYACLSPSTAQISMECTGIVARLNNKRGFEAANIYIVGLVAGWDCLLERCSNIEGCLSGIIEACNHFIVDF